MPGTSGLGLLQTLKAAVPRSSGSCMTAYSDLESGGGAFRVARRIICQPFDVDQAVSSHPPRAWREHAGG